MEKVIDQRWFIIMISLIWGLVMSYLFKKIYVDKKCTIFVVQNEN